MVEKKKLAEAPQIQQKNKTAQQIILKEFINHPLNKKLEISSHKSTKKQILKNFEDTQTRFAQNNNKSNNKAANEMKANLVFIDKETAI